LERDLDGIPASFVDVSSQVAGIHEVNGPGSSRCASDDENLDVVEGKKVYPYSSCKKNESFLPL
jgi:hypothetical protein